MKINASALVAVVMMVGSLAATGCSTANDTSSAIAPEESAATAPTEDSSSTTTTNAFGFFRNEVRVHYYAPHAPPAARFEVRTRAPSARYFWAPGYYHWTGREHMWVGGRWELRRDRFEYIAPHWQQDRFGRWEYLPGVWVRR